MYIDRPKLGEKSYLAKAAKKTQVNLVNTYRRPPESDPKGAYVPMLTLEGTPGYVAKRGPGAEARPR